MTVERGTNYLAGIDPSAILCERLRARGDEVLCVDNFFTSRRQNIAHLRGNPIFNTYGPRMHPNDGRVVSNFIVQALKGEPITLYGTGSQSRSFCFAGSRRSRCATASSARLIISGHIQGFFWSKPLPVDPHSSCKNAPFRGRFHFRPGGTACAYSGEGLQCVGRSYRGLPRKRIRKMMWESVGI